MGLGGWGSREGWKIRVGLGAVRVRAADLGGQQRSLRRRDVRPADVWARLVLVVAASGLAAKVASSGLDSSPC
jgi:hypothetical protein